MRCACSASTLAITSSGRKCSKRSRSSFSPEIFKPICRVPPRGRFSTCSERHVNGKTFRVLACRPRPDGFSRPAPSDGARAGGRALSYDQKLLCVGTCRRARCRSGPYRNFSHGCCHWPSCHAACILSVTASRLTLVPVLDLIIRFYSVRLHRSPQSGQAHRRTIRSVAARPCARHHEQVTFQPGRHPLGRCRFQKTAAVVIRRPLQ